MAGRYSLWLCDDPDGAGTDGSVLTGTVTY
jgi:hypothetical protein